MQYFDGFVLWVVNHLLRLVSSGEEEETEPLQGPCAHCRDSKVHESFTIQMCAMNREQVSVNLCSRCDIMLNKYILGFTNINGRELAMAEYRKTKEAEHGS